MNGMDGDRWDDDRLMALVAEALVAEVLDGEDDCTEATTSAAQGDQPAEISLEDVVAAGRAAFCWLDVVVTLRNVARHHGPAAEASTAPQPATSFAAPPTGSTTTEGR